MEKGNNNMEDIYELLLDIRRYINRLDQFTLKQQSSHEPAVPPPVATETTKQEESRTPIDIDLSLLSQSYNELNEMELNLKEVLLPVQFNSILSDPSIESTQESLYVSFVLFLYIGSKAVIESTKLKDFFLVFYRWSNRTTRLSSPL